MLGRCMSQVLGNICVFWILSLQNIIVFLKSGAALWERLNITMLYMDLEEPILPSKIRPDKILDCTGLYCPEPVFRTRIGLDKMRAGEILEVSADDPAAKEDIKSLVKRLGYELLEFKSVRGRFRFVIRKTR